MGMVPGVLLAGRVGACQVRTEHNPLLGHIRAKSAKRLRSEEIARRLARCPGLSRGRPLPVLRVAVVAERRVAMAGLRVDRLAGGGRPDAGIRGSGGPRGGDGGRGPIERAPYLALVP